VREKVERKEKKREDLSKQRKKCLKKFVKKENIELPRSTDTLHMGSSPISASKMSMGSEYSSPYLNHQQMMK
jgi:hypothetical protein